MSNQTLEGKVEELKRKLIKSEQRVDEISKRVRMLERQVMRKIGVRSHGDKNQCKYCGAFTSRGDLCGRCQAILGEGS